MKFISKHIIVVILCLLIGISSNSCVHTTPRPVGELHRAEFIEKYFQNRDLDLIEGIWNWENNHFEIAIIKNSFGIYTQYDYLGLITDTHKKGWKIGETKLLLKKTCDSYTFIASYFRDRASKGQYGTTLTLKDNNKAALKLRSRGGIRRHPLLLRVYPKLIAHKESPDISNKPPSKYDDFLNCVVVVRSSSAIGTGFFVTKDGYLITNSHVVGRDSTVSIKLKNGRTILGNVLSADIDRDLALIKVEGTLFSWLALGEIASAGVGNDVIAIGTPEGLEWSVSRGIVSAVRSYEDIVIIQTDTAINHGNSGGPLISLKNGKAIGVNSFIVRKDIAEGLNFAISAEEITKAFPQIKMKK